MVSINEVMRAGEKLGKKDTAVVCVPGGKLLLCGTCQAYEDALCAHIRQAYEELFEKFGLECLGDLECAVSEARDRMLRLFEELAGGQLVLMSDEY